MEKRLLPAILILLAGCDYDTPLSQTASAPANPALTGTWTGLSDDDKPVSMKIKTTGTEYNVTYTEGSNTLTFTGFQISSAGLNLIQLELQNADTQKYLFVNYELTPDGLAVYRLNPEVVSAKCETAEELLNDIIVHKKNEFLFNAPLKFRKSTNR